MSKYDYDLIVIGGGAGGLTSSTFAGQSGAKTLLIEKEEKLGGDCLHYGCVPSKSLIKSAAIYHSIKNSEKYGLPPAAVSSVDYKRVSQRIQKIIGTIQKHDEPEYLQEHYNVETQFGSPKFVDDHTISLDGKKITARYFVLSTGSRAFIPSIEGLDNVPYITNVDIFSLERLPENLIVLGAGPIGLEMAQSFLRLGSKVSVIQQGNQILPKEDRDVAEFMQEHLKGEGIELILNSQAEKIEKNGNKIIVTVHNNQTGFNQVVEGDTLLVATGRQANVDELDLQKAGVEYTSRGITVDEKMRTNVKHICAVGDVTGGLQFTHVASYEAVVAIYNAILKIPKKANYASTPWVTYLDPQVASIGHNEQSAKAKGLEYKVHKESFEHNDRALAEGENKGFIKILLGKKDKVLGVQIVSYHAGDLIAEWIPVLNGKVSLSVLSDAIHPYPTMAEINKNAVVNYLVAQIPSWTKKLTKILFGYQGKA